MSDDSTHDTQMEELDYDHGEEILLGGAKKLVVVSLAPTLLLPSSKVYCGFLEGLYWKVTARIAWI
jgi:hypothetical protein